MSYPYRKMHSNMTIVEQRENRKKWVEALRSGKYKQGKEYLAQEIGEETVFCCLGVACELVTPEHEQAYKYSFAAGTQVKSYRNSTRDLPPVVMKALGLRCKSGGFFNTGKIATGRRGYESLVHCNDKLNLTFNEIADIIEAEPQGLFDE